MRRTEATRQRAIRAYYAALLGRWGPQHWWPAQSRFEVIVGAFLTQNTAWTNVEKALGRLRRARRLSLGGIRATPERELAELIRPSGYFRQKAHRLKRFVAWLDAAYGGSLDRMFAQPTARLREELLALHGVGPETADSILLYAGGHEVFVVDAYARRIFERHGLASKKAKYEELRALVEGALSCAGEAPAPPQRKINNVSGESPAPTPGKMSYATGESPAPVCGSDPMHPPSRMSGARRSATAQHCNEFHGLIVRAAKEHCGTRARCEGCPLEKFLPR